MTHNFSDPASEGERAAQLDNFREAQAERIRETYRQALQFTANRLRQLLEETETYLEAANDLAALGALTSFADLAEDVKAAQRLLLSNVRGSR